MKQSLRMLWERRRNTRQLRRPQTWPKFKIPASRCCAAVQEKSHDQVITEISNVLLWLDKLQNSKHDEKDVLDSLSCHKD